jgi:hypothetical protein
MALQSSGPISFSEIANEFGSPIGNNIGAYRISPTIGSLQNIPLDTEIPQTGQISFSNFYGKKLNMVVDLYDIPQDSTRLDAKNRYDNNFVTVVGGFKGKPLTSSGSKVYINVNKRIGSLKGNRNYVALKTGFWDSNTELIISVGSQGGIYGAGGNGGNGGGTGNGTNGTDGTSALGIQYPSKVINQGVIKGGRGGGGGGAAGAGREFYDIQDCKGGVGDSPRIGGGGGAGGSGIPGGNGGSPSTYSYRLPNKGGGSRTFAVAGTGGTFNTDGNGGARGNIVPQDYPSCTTRIGYSGAGGSIESSGGSGDQPYTSPGAGGQRGYAIIIDSTGSLVEPVSGNALQGSTINGTSL